jgi:hypothetical protein
MAHNHVETQFAATLPQPYDSLHPVGPFRLTLAGFRASSHQCFNRLHFEKRILIMANKNRMRRREILQLAALAGAGMAVAEKLPRGAAGETPATAVTAPGDPVFFEIPDANWRLWPDIQAPWRGDHLYLPDEVVLENLPIYAPTGGWTVLDDKTGIAVTLPGTVEQHYWGQMGLRPYKTDEYFFAWDDPEVRCGAYYGVSWWWTRLKIPSSFAGKKLLLRIRGARQRAEVYLNEKLIGYDIIDQTAFTCDATVAARPGEENILAIRITNPGGRFDWPDGHTTVWNNGRFQRSHGFGGLDRGMVLEAHDHVYISDLWAFNTPSVRTVHAHAELHNDLTHDVAGQLRFTVADAQRTPIAHHEMAVKIPPGAGHVYRALIECPDAKLWEIDEPNLYRLHAQFQAAVPALADHRNVTFGFRWFEADGIGSNAMLKLNGCRIRLYTAISWGFWGFNGLWPQSELAEKEVRAAKALNMNCLNFHRQIGREEVLCQQDQLGLLRYMEVGGGEQFASRPADGFVARYMSEKLLRMFRQFRSHPSLVMYCVQNEWSPNLKNPAILAMLKRLHAEDPSRIVTLKDGVVPADEAWYRAGGWKLHYDHGNGFSGWWCQHTAGGGAGSWEDRYYCAPDDFMYRSDQRKQIVEWGEVGGSAVADNHALMVQQIKATGGKSYDLMDHQQILAAYEHFLDRWNFRGAFPTTAALFEALGERCYQWWSLLLENFRIAERVDICAMSGWESTAIENHSGIVDNLRNHKGPPERIAQSLQPVLPLAKLRQTVVNRGDAAELDVFLVNETGKPVTGNIQVHLKHNTQSTAQLLDAPIPRFVNNQFVYGIGGKHSTGPLKHAGMYTLSARLTGHKARYERKILVIDNTGPHQARIHIGLIGRPPAVHKEFNDIAGVRCSPFMPSEKYDLLLLGDGPKGNLIQTTATIAGTPIPWLFQHQWTGSAGMFRFVFNALPAGAAQVTLYFAEIQHNAPGQRQFDVRINGRTVLRDFDIFHQAGGANKAVEERFTVHPHDGTILIEPGNTAQGDAAFAGIKIQAGSRTITAYFGPKAIKQHLGPAELIWQPYTSAADLSPEVVNRIQSGAGLLVMTDNTFFSDSAAGSLARLGAFEYSGHVGSLRSMDNWMGNWIFVRQHPLYAGLPVNCAMKDDYQVPFFNADGLLIDGKNIEVAAAYSRDHDRNIGAATFTAPLGRGKIVYHLMPAMQPIVQRRWMTNALDYLTGT